MTFKQKMMKLLAPYVGTKTNKEKIVGEIQKQIEDNGQKDLNINIPYRTVFNINLNAVSSFNIDEEYPITYKSYSLSGYETYLTQQNNKNSYVFETVSYWEDYIEDFNKIEYNPFNYMSNLDIQINVLYKRNQSQNKIFSRKCFKCEKWIYHDSTIDGVVSNYFEFFFDGGKSIKLQWNDNTKDFVQLT